MCGAVTFRRIFAGFLFNLPVRVDFSSESRIIWTAKEANDRGESMVYIKYTDSPLGRILLSSDGEALTGLWFDGQKYCGAGLAADCAERELDVFVLAERWLAVYFGGEMPDFTPPLHLRGTAFRQKVWQQLCRIPFGAVTTYGAIAAEIAEAEGQDTMSAQAVGGAVGHNPVSLIVPCHRVIGANGSLTGYAGGIERKLWLLKHEQMILNSGGAV